jgi:hypothetical protein
VLIPPTAAPVAAAPPAAVPPVAAPAAPPLVPPAAAASAANTLPETVIAKAKASALNLLFITWFSLRFFGFNYWNRLTLAHDYPDKQTYCNIFYPCAQAMPKQSTAAQF